MFSINQNNINTIESLNEIDKRSMFNILNISKANYLKKKFAWCPRSFYTWNNRLCKSQNESEVDFSLKRERRENS